jgi:hypothetical protein
MQLRNARLCLDCEEIHDGAHCPVCASESIAFISRWVPAPERRARPRPIEPGNPEELETYRQLLDGRRLAGWRIARHGAVGLALVAVAGWLWRRREGHVRRPGETAPNRTEPPDSAA